MEYVYPVIKIVLHTGGEEMGFLINGVETMDNHSKRRKKMHLYLHIVRGFTGLRVRQSKYTHRTNTTLWVKLLRQGQHL